MVKAIDKGKNGEREAAAWLQEHLQLEVLPTRNLDQTREGGYDLLGLQPFAVEVKRCETLSLVAWWRQVKEATPHGMCPIVMFRQNRKQWRFLLPARLIGVDIGFIEVGGSVFKEWAKCVLTNGEG